MDREEFLKRVRSYIKVPTKETEELLDSFCEHCTYIAGKYDEDEPFKVLNRHLEDLEHGRDAQNRVFYMALPPSVFVTVSEHLKKNCYPKHGVARIIVSSPISHSRPSGSALPPGEYISLHVCAVQVEKPFGKDLQSSRELAKALEPNWKEEEIFRIDHYLGKEMVKNILIMRFGNEFFGATWNRHHIDNVQVRTKCV